MELRWKENLNTTPVLVNEEEDVMKVVKNMEENIETKVNQEEVIEEKNKVISIETSNENDEDTVEEDVEKTEEVELNENNGSNKSSKKKTKATVTKIKWHEEIPENERYQSGDIIYNSHYDKFGIFNQYGSKKDRIQMNLLCKNSKDKTFEKPWRVPTDSTKLVKRNGIVQDGFIETETGFEKAE